MSQPSGLATMTRLLLLPVAAAALATVAAAGSSSPSAALAAPPVYVSNFQATYDDGPYHDAVAFDHTSDGGYVYVGTYPAPAFGGAQHIRLVKLNASFQPVWDRTYALAGELAGTYPWPVIYQPRDVAQNLDRGYLVCGRVASEFGFDEGFLLRTDPAGNAMWLNTYPRLRGLSSCAEVTTTASATTGFVAVGDAKYGGGTGGILRTDSAGNGLWSDAVWGTKGSASGIASYAKVIPYKGRTLFAATGSANANATDRDLLLTTFDAGGTYGLNRIYGQTVDASGNYVFEHGSGLVEVVGGHQPGLAVAGHISAAVPDV